MSGLEAAMANMMQQYSRPIMRAPIQQGIIQNNPPAYRPDMSGINANLTRVAPSVEMQKRLAAEEAARQAAMNPGVVDSGGGSSGGDGGGGDGGGD
jgi:hypothetical protein